jgi:hypothetical protein
MRQGGDPRLPLELALVKVTRPASDLSREAIAYRLDQLEQGAHRPVPPRHDRGSDPGTRPEPAPEPEPAPVPVPVAVGGGPSLELETLQEAWQRSILPAVEEKSIPFASILREAHPAELADDTLTVEFPRTASFHRQLAEDPKNTTLLAEALYEVTGRRLGLAFAVGDHVEAEERSEAEGPAGEDRILELLSETLDAREREEQQ